MSTIAAPDRFTTLPDERMIASAVTALEEHGFGVEVVDDLGVARQTVLARIPHGSSVMTNTSVTLQESGTLVISSASGSQLASYAWGAANVILVVDAQKLVPTLEAAHERIYQHSLVLEDARAIDASGQHSSVGKIPEIRQELPGRIHIVLVRQVDGF
jgi:L-lactate utilization protein LutC